MKRSMLALAVLASGVAAGAILLAGAASARVSGDCPGGSTGPALSLSPAYWPSMLPPATVGQHYEVKITVSGGSSGQYEWELSPSDLNGSGLTMDHPGGRYGATLLVSGTPTAAGGPYSFMVGVADTDTPGGQICAVFYPTGGARYEVQINGPGSSPAPDWKNLRAFDPLDAEIAKMEADLNRAAGTPSLASIDPPALPLPLLPKQSMLVPSADASAFERDLAAAATALAADLAAKPTPAQRTELVLVERSLAAAMDDLQAPGKPAEAKRDATKLAAVAIDNADEETFVTPPLPEPDRIAHLADAAHLVEQARLQETEAELAAGEHQAATFHKELQAGINTLGRARDLVREAEIGGELFTGEASGQLFHAVVEDMHAMNARDAATKVSFVQKSEQAKKAALGLLEKARNSPVHPGG